MRSDAKKPDEPKSPLQDQNPVITSVAKKGADASDEDIIQGKVQITQEDIDALQERLEAKGIKQLEDLINATPTEVQAMRAVLSTVARDEAQRRVYLSRLNNVMATGSADYNAQELDSAVLAERTEGRMQQAEERQGFQAETSRMAQETARLNYFQTVENHEWKVSEKVGGRIRDNFKKAKGAIFGVDGDGNIGTEANFDEGRFLSEYRGAFEDMYREFKNAPSGTRQKGQTKIALNSMISMGIQALAESEEYGKFAENFSPDGGIDYIDGNDAALSRLEIKPDGSVAVIDRTTGQQVDETVSRSMLRKVFGESGYAYFVKEIRRAKATAGK